MIRFGRMQALAIAAVAVVVGALSPDEALAEPEVTRLDALTPNGAAGVGTEVALDGDRLLTFAPNPADVDRRIALVLARGPTGWEVEDVLEPPPSHEFLSGPIALADPVAVVGDTVYRRHGTEWVFEDTLVTTTEWDETNAHLIVTAVAISGGRIAVGRPVADGQSGGVSVFTAMPGTEPGSFAWPETTVVRASDGRASSSFAGIEVFGDGFGRCVALAGDILVVGAPERTSPDALALREGSAYVFEHRDGEWAEIARLRADTPVPSENFGRCVAVSGDTVVIGAQGAVTDRLENGRVYVFDRQRAPDGTARDSFVRTSALELPGRGAPGALGELRIRSKFGATVAIEDDVLVAGAPGLDVYDSDDRGGAVVFRRVAWSRSADGAEPVARSARGAPPSST